MGELHRQAPKFIRGINEGRRLKATPSASLFGVRLRATAQLALFGPAQPRAQSFPFRSLHNTVGPRTV